MAEKSRFWDGTSVGDATIAPYDAGTEFAEAMMSFSGTVAYANKGAVLRHYLGELAATGAASPVSIASGQAIVYGSWYNNDAAVSVAVTNPASATRYDRIVLRKNWSTQTVRVTHIVGVEGAGVPPALVQIVGDRWDTPLWTVRIVPVGTITLTDERVWTPNVYGNVGASGLPPTVQYFVRAGSFPFASFAGITFPGTMVTVPGLPASAIAAIVAVQFSAPGANPSLGEVSSDLTVNTNSVLAVSVPTSGAQIPLVQVIVPITVPQQIGIVAVSGTLTVAISIVGWTEYA